MLGLAALNTPHCQCTCSLCCSQAHAVSPDEPLGPAQACCRPGWPPCGWQCMACHAAHLALAWQPSTYTATCALQPGEHYAMLMGPSWTALEHELAYTMHCSIRGYWDQWNKQQSPGSFRLPAPQVVPVQYWGGLTGFASGLVGKNQHVFRLRISAIHESLPLRVALACLHASSVP